MPTLQNAWLLFSYRFVLFQTYEIQNFLLGLLRLQTQLGDYHQALKAIENVSLDMKTSGIYIECATKIWHNLLVTDAADCLIATYYYEAWCKIMLRKYQDAIDSLQEVLLYIERGRKTVLNKGKISETEPVSTPSRNKFEFRFSIQERYVE